MPNYKLPPSLREHMVKRAADLAKRRVDIAHQDFPMTFEELQDALMPGAQRKTIKKLINDGVDTFYRSLAVKFVLPKVHGIDRAVSVKVWSANNTTEFYYFKKAQQSGVYSYNTNDAFSDSQLSSGEYYIDTEILTPEKQQLLAAWVNNSVRERRMVAITNTVVKWFLENACEVDHITAAHVMARWPTIAMLVEGQMKYSNPDDAAVKLHKSRLRNVPEATRLNRWGWRSDDPEYAKRRNMIKVADMVLTSASMLPEVKPAKDQLVAAVNNYEKFPGEKF